MSPLVCVGRITLRERVRMAQLSTTRRVNQCMGGKVMLREGVRMAQLSKPGESISVYWAIQAWLLTHLTFARHRLSPLAVFTSGAYFLHNGRR